MTDGIVINQEYRKQRISSRMSALETAVRNCDPIALSHAYILGEIQPSMEIAKNIAMLIAEFEIDCGCIKKIK